MRGEIPTSELPTHEEVLSVPEKQESLGEVKEITDADLLCVIALLKKEYSKIFDKVLIDIGDPKVEIPLQTKMAIWGPEGKKGYRPRISLSEKMEDEETKMLAVLEKEKPEALEKIIEKLKEALGGRFKELDGKILKIFILSHEAGHVKEYFEKFKTSFLVSYKSAFERRREQYNVYYGALPVPGVLSEPARKFWQESHGRTMKERIENMITLIKNSYFGDQGPRRGVKFDEHRFRINLESWNVYKDPASPAQMEKMLEAQERLQKGLLEEQFADNFAVEFLKKHWQDFGLDKK